VPVPELNGGGRPAALQVHWDAAAGGAITSLVSAGREWLVQGRRSRPSGDRSYVAEPPRGWDELIPTIDECLVDGVPLPDHGEAWRSPWEKALQEGPQEDGVTLRFASPRGYRLSRSIRSSGTGVRLDYAVEADVEQPFLWAAHPLLLAEPGTAVDLGGWAGDVTVVTALGRRTVPLCPELLAIDGLDVGAYRKVVLPAEAQLGSAALVHPDGSRLAFSWDVDVVPYLAVYLERRACTERDCIAVEPMTGWYDSLARALSAGLVSRVAPARPVRWHLDLVATAPG
jgi:hypothetical protein